MAPFVDGGRGGRVVVRLEARKRVDFRNGALQTAGLQAIGFTAP